MNWLTWQQHKRQFLIVGILVAAFAALAIPTGMHFWDTYQGALSSCETAGTCDRLRDQLFNSGFDSRMLLLMKAALIAAPFMLAVFWGVPLIAREYSESTNLLVWTQGASRRKWLTVTLAWTLVAAAAVMGLFAALSTWWWRTGNALYLDRFEPLNFGIQGIVPVAFVVFAVTVGIAFGTWLKRLLPAMALTFGVLIAVQVVVPTMVRPHYTQPVTKVTAMSAELNDDAPPDQPPRPSDAGAAWVTGGDLYSKDGKIFNWDNPEACTYTHEEMEAIRNKPESNDRQAGGYVGRENGSVIGIGCLVEKGYEWHVQYHPSYRYWNFQRIEAALYIGLAILPLGATYWLVLKRDA